MMAVLPKLLLHKQASCPSPLFTARKRHMSQIVRSQSNTNTSDVPVSDELQQRQPGQPNDHQLQSEQQQQQQSEQQQSEQQQQLRRQQQQLRRRQQQQQQQSYPPGYDPKAAAGFMPLPGDKPFWWVEKFEQRRRQLAEQNASGSSSSSGNEPTTNPNTSSSSSSSKQQESNSSSSNLLGPHAIRKAAVQLLQLAVVNAALILWPASLYPGSLAVTQVWLCYWCYMLFFGGGSVYRLIRFGPLAKREKDKQSKTVWSTVSWLMFVVAMPVIHWSPVVGLLKRQQQQQQQQGALAAAAASGSSSSSSFITAYDVIGFSVLIGAIALNWWSAQHLGKAYDRVVQPDALVTTGPYAFVQHPIYSSYMLLFVGYCMMLHSAPTALLALVVCLVYYASRTRLEKAVLQQAFGQQYDEYARRTKLFIPGVL